MPELPEVERASRHVKLHAQNKRIQKVDVFEDSIVFSGTSHTDFAKALTNRTVTDVKRYGKVFFIELDGEGPLPVLHFGMTGNVHVKGQSSLVYKEGTKKPETQWPPRFCKFVLHLLPPHTKPGKDCTEIAFVDARRLGRIRLCNKPMEEPPISALGFDPILSMPSVEDFAEKVLARSCAIKALLLDQSFSAGVGNWIADEILYHSRIHPEQRTNTLSAAQMKVLYEKMKFVCETAVAVNADHTKFPDDWLFPHRWGKGKHKSDVLLKLPSGKPATIKWLTAGGRTSAIVTELQRKNAVKQEQSGGELGELEEPLTEEKMTQQKRTRGTKRKASETVIEVEETKIVQRRSRRGKRN